MSVDFNQANQLSLRLIRLMKLIKSVRSHAPRLHPAVESAAYPIMFNLVDGPKRVSSVADCVHSDVSTVSRQASCLAAYGLLEKLQDPEDGRVWMLSLTTEGKELVEDLAQQRGEWFRRALQEWDATEVEQFSRLLERLTLGCEHEYERLMKRTEKTKETRP